LGVSIYQRAFRPEVGAGLFTRGRIVAGVLALIALLLVVLIAHDVFFPPAPSTVASRATAVTRGTVRSAVSGTGTVVPAAQQNVSFGVAGTLAEIDVKVGDRVTAGQALAKLDLTTFQQALDQAGNSVQQAQATLNNTLSSNAVPQAQHALAAAQQSLADAQAQASLTSQIDATTLANDQSQFNVDHAAGDTAKEQQDQQKILSDQNKLALDQLQGQHSINQATASVTTAQDALNSQTIQRPNTIASQQAALANAQLVVQTAQRNLDSTTLTAPISGTVNAIGAQVGEAVSAGSAGTAQSPGSTAPQPSSSGATSGASGASGASSGSSSFMVLGNVAGLQVVAPFAEADAARLQSSQQASVTFDAVTGLSLPAHVLAIATASSVISNVTNYYATLILDRIDQRLKAGMTANAQVVVSQAAGVLTLPNSAISRVGGSSFVNLLRPDGRTMARQPVETGTVGDSTTEIVSGLNEGDRVVLPQLRTPSQQGTTRVPTGGNLGGGGGGLRAGGG
jgi:multidrug efflux pump subunit AcrA (membrane-fusion protein)